MSNINTFINSVVARIGSHLPALKTCVALPGYLETTDLNEVHKKTPGVFVAAVGTGEIHPVETGESDVTLQMVAYLLVVNSDALQREQTAQELMTDLLVYISSSGQRWGVDDAHPTGAIESADVHGLTKDFQPHVKDWRMGTAVLARAADLYGSTEPISNLALWAITWEQILRIGINDFAPSGGTIPDSPQVKGYGEEIYIPVVGG